MKITRVLGTRGELPEKTLDSYKKLLQTAIKARKNAYVPRSNYAVGAAVLTDTGKIYTGSNMEFTSFIDHAEMVAVGKAIASGEKKIVAISTFGSKRGEPLDYDQTPPCGNCRQALFDLNPKMKDIEAHGPHTIHIYTASQNLPKGYFRKREPFVPPQEIPHSHSRLIQEAFKARSHAYVPKSRYPIGAAVEADGKIFKGSSVDISSFPLDPIRLALASAISSGKTKIKRIAVVAGNNPSRGEAPPNLNPDSLEALRRLAPNAQILLPDKSGHFVSFPVKKFLTRFPGNRD